MNLLITSCNFNKKHQEILLQVRNNLELQNNVATIFNERNIPLSEILAEAKINKYDINKSKFKIIDSLTLELNVELKKSIKQIEIFKNEASDREFYNATFEYLKAVDEMEAVNRPFFESIKDSIKNNEESLSVIVSTKGRKVKSEIENWKKVKSEIENWKKVKSEFYEQHSIKEKEIDSIVELIKAE